MKIAKYVGDLLYDYECVVIPGLGGFITKDSPVSINEVTHNFSPPFRNVHFNIHLRANDGLLVNHIAQQEQIGYKTAKQKVDQFAFQCHNALESGKKINFKNVGSIYHDNDKNIVFTQDIKSNYNPNSFGLDNLISPAIRRITDEERIKNIIKSTVDSKSTKNKPIDRKSSSKKDVIKNTSGKKMQANRRKTSFANQIIFLLIVAFIMGSGYIYMRRYAMEYYFDKYAAHIPFFYSSVNDYLATNINSTHVAKLSRSTASFFPSFIDKEDNQPISNEIEDNEIISEIDVESNNQPIVITETNNDEPIDVEVINNSTDKIVDNYTNSNKVISNKKIIEKSRINNRFFIIAGSFSKESNAQSLVNKLINSGYEALIADTNKYGMYRVAFMSFSNRANAESKLLAIRNAASPTAWLLVK